MPLPALIAGGAAIAGAGINAWQTGRMNKKSIEFSREMYNRQYTDNLNLWHMQNEYNSPAAQMQRFTDAGLNPALIYGQQNTSGPLGSPDVQKPQFDSPRVGDAIPNALSAIDLTTNLEMKQAQIDNIKAQNDVIRAEAVLKNVLISGGETANKSRLLDYNKNLELYDTDVSARKEGLRKLQTEIDIMTNRDTREALMNASNLNEATERIKSMVVDRALKQQNIAHSKMDVQRIRADRDRILEQIDLMKKEGTIKDLDVWLSQQAIRPGDPTWYRAIASLFDTMINKFGK